MELTEQQIKQLPIESESVKRLFVSWISGYPESFHPLDMARWAELAFTALENDIDIDLYNIEEEVPLYLDDNIEHYMNLYYSMKDLYNLMKKNGYRKI